MSNVFTYAFFTVNVLIYNLSMQNRICLATLSFFPHSDTYLLLVGSVFMFFTGGMMSFLTTSYRYIVLHYNGDRMPIRFALFQFSARIGEFVS